MSSLFVSAKLCNPSSLTLSVWGVHIPSICNLPYKSISQDVNTFHHHSLVLHSSSLLPVHEAQPLYIPSSLLTLRQPALPTSQFSQLLPPLCGTSAVFTSSCHKALLFSHSPHPSCTCQPGLQLSLPSQYYTFRLYLPQPYLRSSTLSLSALSIIFF